MRTKIVAGNWKMNKDLKESEDLLKSLTARLPETIAEVMVAPPFVHLATAVSSLSDSDIRVIAQNMHFEEYGAFTGEVSAPMLLGIGVDTVILGHSERRALFQETDELLSKKAKSAIAHKMRLIFCIGEELRDRKADRHFEVVKHQLEAGLFNLKAREWSGVILAYEPVWAIGTGETATPQQAQEMHAFIRKTIADAYSPELADSVTILYGGSVKPANAREIFSKPDVDGGLIGGASLVVDDFLAIIGAVV